MERINTLMDQIKAKYGVQYVSVDYVGGAWLVKVYRWHEHHKGRVVRGPLSRQREKLEDAAESVLNPEDPSAVVPGNNCTNACPHYDRASY